jgi:hypothetical protein
MLQQIRVVLRSRGRYTRPSTRGSFAWFRYDHGRTILKSPVTALTYMQSHVLFTFLPRRVDVVFGALLRGGVSSLETAPGAGKRTWEIW